MTKQRLWQLDALRGLALLNMLAYHAMYDWVYVFGHASSWYNIGAAGCHVLELYFTLRLQLYAGPPPAEKWADRGRMRCGADRGDGGVHAVGEHLVRCTALKRRRCAAELPD